MTTPDFSSAHWHRSTYSDANGGECVEAATAPVATALRDSQHPDHAMLVFPNAEWRAFLRGIQQGAL
jgi:hypothetical protein